MNSYYGQPSQREENNNLGTAIGALGAGALLGFGGRALYKNIDARRAKSKATGGPRGGQGGAITRNNPTAQEYAKQQASSQPLEVNVVDLGATTSPVSKTSAPTASRSVPALQSREQAVYGRAANKYPDPGVGRDVQYRFPGGGTEQSMLITDEATGQIFRRGGGLSQLEVKAGITEQPVVKTAAYEEGSAVDKLIKSLLPEVNKEAGQMTATESSRQTRALAKQDDQATQAMARGILSELKEKQPVGTQVNPEKLARIEANRNKDLQRISGYMSDVIESVVDEDTYDTTPAAILQINNKAMEGTLSADDVAAFQQWSNTTFKNDPTVLSEINENIYGINDLLAPKAKQPVGEQLKSKGLAMAGMPGEGPLQIDDGMRLINIDSPAGVEVLSNAGVTPEQATSYWSDKLKREGITAEQPATLVQVQESREPQVTVNSMETVNTADDQSDGRFLRSLQRNEDVNMAAVSEAVVDNKEAVLDSRISDALRYLRGKEIDTNFDYSAEEAIQARQVGQRFERAQALQALGNQVIEEVQAEGVVAKPIEAAQGFLTTRRENLTAKGGVGPARVEQQLAADVVGKTGFGARAMADVATPSNLKKYEGVSNLGPDAVAKKAASGTSIRGRSRSVDQPDPINRQRSSTPEFQDVSVSVTGEPIEQGLDTQSVVVSTNEPTQAVRRLPATGQRTTTGELRQLTPEQKDTIYGTDMVRGALPLGAQERAPRGPVRRFQETLTEAQEELVDTDGGGVGLGVYGLETDYTPGAVRYDGSYSAASEQQPTTYRVSPYMAENAPNSFAGLSDEQLGQVSMQGTEAEAYNADKMLAKRRSFDVAQDLRRIQNSGRPDAQKQVKSYLDELMANEIPGVDFS